MSRRIALAVLVGGTLTLGAHAQEPSATAQPTPQATARCAGLEQDAARLACYDALFRTTPAVAEAGFGLERRDTRSPETLETIASPIATLERLRDGTVRVTLENGQVWRQIEGSPPQWRTGERLLVERAALGSFLAATDGSRRYVRVRRER